MHQIEVNTIDTNCLVEVAGSALCVRQSGEWESGGIGK